MKHIVANPAKSRTLAKHNRHMSEADEEVEDWEKDYAGNIPLGTHIKVYWTGERRWFVGVIDNARWA